MTTTLYRSARCCTEKPGCAYATLTVSQARSEISVHLQGTPCCTNEFQSLLALLRTIRETLDLTKTLRLHYTLTNVTLDSNRMKAQEQALLGPKIVCAIVCANALIRTAVGVATSMRPGVKTFKCAHKGRAWLQSKQ